MTLKNTAPDNLDLGLVKEHLVVDHGDDDALIQSYINASLGYVEAYIHDPILQMEYEADPNEMLPVNMEYRLQIPKTPKIVLIRIGTHTDILPPTDWSYQGSTLTIPVRLHVTPSAIVVMAGAPEWIDAINQARLMLIGQFYNYRENVADLRIMELPTGVKFILDNVTGASI
jgi:hypothetical protein